MKIKLLLLFLCCLFSFKANSQQFSLYNSRTLYDAFENPAQKAFKLDTSRKYAFNFFIPNFGTNVAAIGDAQFTFRTLLAKQAFTGQQAVIGEGKYNTVLANINTYLLMFRIFKTVQYEREMGFAWQVRSDNTARITNETLAILDNYRLFSANSYSSPFNNKAVSQSYHQFSFNYRENYNSRLGFGVKLSYISGIAYNKLDIDSSSLKINREAGIFNLHVKGQFRSNFFYNDADEKMLYPGLKNPGFAVTTSMFHKPGNGWYLMGNLKDIGFIRWSKTSNIYRFNNSVNATNSNVGNKLDSLITSSREQKSFSTMLNGKAEILVNKNLGFYQPNFLLSKNLFYRGADIGLINNFTSGKFTGSVSTVYNTNKMLQVGGLGMFRTPNFEFFMGTDQVFKDYYAAKALITADNNIGKGYTGASFYMGFAVKFGPSMEHPMNANLIPGVENYDKDSQRPGFFQRLFKKKPK